MKTRFLVALLDDSASRAAARIVAAQLEKTEAAAERLKDSEDHDALHDFRVGLRRLRSALRAYRPWLGRAASRKVRSQLRDLGRATNRGRDAEVQAAWIREIGGKLSAVSRKGTGRLLQQLRRRRTSHLVDLEREFREVGDRIRKRLDLGANGAETFATVYAGLVARYSRVAVDCIAAVRRPDQVEEAHEARIAVKRLRYLIDPVAPEVPAAAEVSERLETLQDLLGALHDAHVLEEELASASEQREAPVRAIKALEARNRERRDRCFSALDADWLAGRGDPLFESIGSLVGERLA